MFGHVYWFSTLAAICAALAYIRYVYCIRARRTVPTIASWVIWSVVGMVILFSYAGSGAKATLFAPFMYAIGPPLALLATYKYTTLGWSRKDTVALCLSLGSVPLWWHFHGAWIALLINIALDIWAFEETIVKVRIKPADEDWLAWSCTSCSGVLSIFAVEPEKWAWSKTLVWSYPIIIAICNGLVAYYAVQPMFRKKVALR
jgi:hypothetical protein